MSIDVDRCSALSALSLFHSALQMYPVLWTMNVIVKKNFAMHFAFDHALIQVNIIIIDHRSALLQLLDAISRGEECSSCVILDESWGIRVPSD